MLTMKWMTDHEGRLVAAWEETRRQSETPVYLAGFRETLQHATLPSPAKRVGFFISLFAMFARVWKLPPVFVRTLLLSGRASAAHATKVHF